MQLAAGIQHEDNLLKEWKGEEKETLMELTLLDIVYTRVIVLFVG